MADGVTSKKRKYSKSKKKNWRKFADVKDVETYLEERSREERAGGPAADKADEDLFVISTEGAQEGAAPLQSGRHWHQLNTLHSRDLPPSDDVQRSGRSRKRASAGEAAEEVNMCASDSESSESREPSLAQLKRSRLGRKALHRARRMPPAGTGRGVEEERWGGVWGVWDAGDDPSKEDEEEQLFLQMTGKNKPKLPKTLTHRQPSLLPAVEVAGGGASYNPSFGDHQDLLRVAVAEAEAKEKEEGKVERWYNGMPQLGHLQREHIWLKEMSEGLFEDVPSADEGSGQDSDVAAYKQPIRADNRRTAKQKRKDKERKEEHAQQVTEKQRRIREGEVYRLKTLKKEIRRNEALWAKKMETRQEKSALGRKTLRLGRIRYEEPDTAVKLSSELSGSLRQLQPEGSIAQDRYKSLLKRNIMEPRKRFIQRRKYKLRLVEKRSCRMPEDDM